MSTNLNIYSKSQTDSLLATKATIIKASGAPTTSTAGEVGDFYFDTTNHALYECTAKTGAGEPIVYTYTWEAVGGGAPNLTFRTLYYSQTSGYTEYFWDSDPGIFAFRIYDTDESYIVRLYDDDEDNPTVIGYGIRFENYELAVFLLDGTIEFANFHIVHVIT